MALMAWSDSYGVGNAVLGSDHRILLNQSHDTVETGQSLDVAAAAGPGLAPHRASHHDLEARVCDIRDRWLRGERHAPDDEVLMLLKKWLTDHILGVDKSYRPWIEGMADRGGSTGPQQSARG